MAGEPDRQRRKKDQERELLGRFFDDLGSYPTDWSIAEEGERPDFLVDHAGRRLGIEITELLTPSSGRERAGERNIASVIRDAVARFVARHGGHGAVVDGHLHDLPRSQREAAGLQEDLERHLREHGAPLARDRGSMVSAFSFQWGVVSRVERNDMLGSVMLFADGLAHQTTLTARDGASIESQLIAAVENKVGKAKDYDGRHPLWLVVRNPYTHLPTVFEATRREVDQLNSATFERIYCHNLKMNVWDARPPRPRVVAVNSLPNAPTGRGLR